MTGYLLAFLSAVFGSAKDLVSKKLSFNLSGLSSGLASFSFALPFYAVAYLIVRWLGWESSPLTGYFWLLVGLRALTDSIAESLKMTSFVHGDISMVTAFFAMSPLFLLLLSPLITGDWPTWLGAIGVLVAVAGSLIMVWHQGESERKRQKKGILLALGSALFFSLNTCFDRLAVLEAGPVTSGFGMTAVSALFLLPFALRKTLHWQGQMGPLFLRGLFEIMFMIVKLSALVYLQAPYVAAFQKFALLISILVGGRIFKEKDLARRMVGACFILSGGLLIVFGG